MPRNVPFEVSMSWPTPNYEHPETRGGGLVVVSACLIATCAIVVFLRLWVRIGRLGWFGADDAFILLALVTAVAMTAVTTVAFQYYGWDRHIWDIPPAKITMALKLEWWTKILYTVAACFTRLSFLAFYYRLTHESTLRRSRICVLAAVILSTLSGAALLFLNIFQCSPVASFWTFPRMESMRCLHDGRLTLGAGIANTSADLMVLILPIPLIARLKLPLRRRIGAIFLVSLGFLVCIAGIVRAYYTWLSLIHGYDLTWLGFGVYVSAAVEIDLGIICACLPALRLVCVRVLRPRLSHLTKSVSNHSPFGSKSVTERTDKTISSMTIWPFTKSGKGEVVMSTSCITTTSISPPPDVLRKDTLISNTSFNTTKPLSAVEEEMQPSSAEKVRYLWDEPWNGANGPTTRRHSADALTDALARRSTMTGQVEIAIPVMLARAKSSASYPLRMSTHDVPRITVEEFPHLARLPESLRSSVISVATEYASVRSRPTSLDSDGTSLPIQMTPSSMLDPSPVPVPEEQEDDDTTLRISASSLRKARPPLFHFEIDLDKGLEAMRARSATGTNDGIRWSEYRPDSRDGSAAKRYVKQQHGLLKDAILHDRIRALNGGRKGEEIDRDPGWMRPPLDWA